jgi:hypothetical protein
MTSSVSSLLNYDLKVHSINGLCWNSTSYSNLAFSATELAGCSYSYFPKIMVIKYLHITMFTNERFCAHLWINDNFIVAQS